MTKEKTLTAVEVMRRAAEGEPVERNGGILPYWHPWNPMDDGESWDWVRFIYRIAEPPPHGPNAHNPDNLTPLQVETHLGWRLLDRDEITGFARSPVVDQWLGEDGWDSGSFGVLTSSTYRTKLTREELAEARGIRKSAPWSKHEHVPPLCWLRGTTGDHLVVYVGRCGVSTNAMRLTWKDLEIQPWEYSTDRVTWKPCTISE